jgi:hypothetical protein
MIKLPSQITFASQRFRLLTTTTIDTNILYIKALCKLRIEFPSDRAGRLSIAMLLAAARRTNEEASILHGTTCDELKRNENRDPPPPTRIFTCTSKEEITELLPDIRILIAVVLEYHECYLGLSVWIVSHSGWQHTISCKPHLVWIMTCNLCSKSDCQAIPSSLTILIQGKTLISLVIFKVYFSSMKCARIYHLRALNVQSCKQLFIFEYPTASGLFGTFYREERLRVDGGVSLILASGWESQEPQITILQTHY